ncbi:zinc fingers and homeoboxes protein 1 [Erythrolamprus reginae]|uniref:zinc fingers and homeoboxes protein 1 n=1 Tax=Erythrolamprus reginae TaxID=121349 RepID=UPI00396CD453
MASKRKSTVPCMVPARESEMDPEAISDVEEVLPVTTSAGSISSDEDSGECGDSDSQPNKKVEGGYECKYCTFQTPDLNMFTFHVDSEHPNVVLSSSYVCLECKFVTKRYDALSEHNTKFHPGEDNFKLNMVKRNNKTIFEQTVNDLTFDGSFVQEEKTGEESEGSESQLTGISISKTPIMKMMKNKNETKRIAVFHNGAEEDPTEEKDGDTDAECEEIVEKGAAASSDTNTDNSSAGEAAPTTVINSTTVIQPAQVITTLASPPTSNLISKVLIPINSIPAYNTALDNNPLLQNTYNKFPYPTVSEIALLATQAKYTEEQIKIWFSAQRLKHGVSWTPEEVEEARRKQFNGTVHTVPQTITVIPAHISAAGNGLPSILQTCQIVGQPGLVLTQVAGTSMSAPITLTMAGVSNPAQLQKAQGQATQPVPESKQVAAVPVPQLMKSEVVAAAAIANIDMVAVRAKKTKEQLMELKISYLKSHFPLDSEIIRLMETTGLTKGEIKKWFSDTRYNQRNSKNNYHNNQNSDSCTIIIDSSDETSEPPMLVQPPQKLFFVASDLSSQKFKDMTAEQLKVLRDSFHNLPVLSEDELNRICLETNLAKEEIEAWFAEQKEREELSEGHAESQKEIAAAETSGGEGSGALKAGKPAKKSPEQLHMLKMSFIRTQWPSSEEYDKLAQETALPRTEIVSWFGDTRYAWKNGGLKWYYYYQGNNAKSSNGQGHSRRRGRGRSKGRGRGRTRGRLTSNKRPKPWERTPVIKFKTGKAILKDYYLKHRFLNEQDLDELVARSRMGYEQVREWFGEKQRRADLGLELFDEEDEEDMEQEDEEEEEEDGETDDSDNWEPPRHVRRRLSKSD